MQLITRILIFLFSCWLCSCSLLHKTTKQDGLLNQKLQLTSPRFLSQTRYISWISWSHDIDINTIEYPWQQAGCVSHANDCLPTLSEYNKDPQYWQNWQRDSNGSQFRILGVLPAGTMYHFYRVDVPEDLNNGVIVFYSIIDSGKYKQAPAYYKYSLNNKADKEMIRKILPFLPA